MRIDAAVVRAAVFLAIVATVSPVSAAEKRAVLVGINDYTASHLPPAASPLPASDRDWQNLEGAVNDVSILSDLLVSRFGFERSNIVVLTDQQATRAAILEALDRNLVEAAKSDDVAFFCYSGHGSQVENSRSDEPDHMDESIVPADSRLGAADIRDKELRRIFNQILDRGARLTVVFDSCHSGSGARGFDAGPRPRSVRPDLRDIADGSYAGPPPESRGALVVAAAQDFDLAYELRDSAGAAHGAFSWAFENGLREAVSGEPAIETFRRAQARLRLEMPAQDPMIAGNSAERLTPFLSARNERPQPKRRIGVERANPDGTYVLQGGWVDGITIGAELQANGVRLEVTALRGIARCDARAVQPIQKAALAMLSSGTLLDVVAWAAPPGRPLRVWMPVASQETLVFARELKREALRRKIRWVSDPTATAATHLLRWRGGRWEMLGRGTSRAIDGANAMEILRGIPSGSSLFMQLPAPESLVEAAGLHGKDDDGIELTADPRSADYILSGRYAGGRIEYAWLRRSFAPLERGRVTLPQRSRWIAAGAVDAPRDLYDLLIRLRRVLGWQRLESPGDAALPYDLAIRRAGDGSLVSDGVLAARSAYRLVLRPRPGGASGEVQPRYVYVFVVDSAGRSVLLFPSMGSVENRLPINPQAPRPSEISLGERTTFRVTAPYGVETCFLLTTDEALPDPWALEWDGVRAVTARGTSPLQQLLALGGMTRAPLAMTPNWSLQKLVFQSVPRLP